MDFHYLHVYQKDGYAVIQVNNPPVNSLSDGVKKELHLALKSLELNNRAIVLTGTGEKAFVAGADIKELAKLDEEAGNKRVIKSQELFSYIENYPLPIIAAINASAFGGGFELVLCCDVCISTEEAKFGLPEVNLGVIPGGGGTQRLTKVISPGLAKLMIYTGKVQTAPEALSLGIVQVVTEKKDLLSEAEKLAEKLSKKAPLALQSGKIAINCGLQTDFESGINKEGELFARLCGTEDKNEGVNAFLEKRKASFKGV